MGAYEFCLYKNDGTKILPCIGNSIGGTTSFPWVFSGDSKDIKNTNSGKVIIYDNPPAGGASTGPSQEFLGWYSIPQWNNEVELAVDGNIIAKGFCLGKSCININTGGTGDTTNNWKEAITNIIGDIGKEWESLSGGIISTKTDTDKVAIGTNTIRDITGTTREKVDVDGLVISDGFCLGKDCVQLDPTSTTNQTTIVKNWQELINKNQSGLNFPVSIVCANNTPPLMVDGLGASCNGVSIFPAAIKICPADNVIKVSVNSGVASAQCVKTPSPIYAVCGNNQVLKWKEFYITGTYYKTWVCADDIEGSKLTINNTNATTPLAGTTNKIVKFTGNSSIGDSKLTDDGTFITNSVPVKTTGGFILENRTNDTVPAGQIGRMWIRSDI